jgi:hypothetical protein
MWPEGQPASHRLDRAGTLVVTKDGFLQVREPFGGKPWLLTKLHPSLDTGGALSQMAAGTVDCRPGRPASPRSSTRPALPRPDRSPWPAAWSSPRTAHPTVRVEPTVRPGSQRHLRRPCHRVAFTAVLHGPRADNHGQPQSSRELRRSPSSQVTAAPDLALGAGDQFVEACVGLAVPGRPILSQVAEAGAPEASPSRPDQPLGPCWVRGALGPQGHEGHKRSPTVQTNRRSSLLQLKRQR